jgi:HD domain
MRDRLRQYRDASRLPSDADYALARRALPPALYELFAAQHPRDVVHAAATARWLLERGHDEGDLIAAALLHDVGKGVQRRRDRVAYVLSSAAGVDRVLGSSRSRFELRQAIARSRAHSDAGAAMIASAGGSDRVVYLTRFHHASRSQDPVIALLQQADEAN